MSKSMIAAIGIATIFILCATAGAIVVMNDNGGSDTNDSSSDGQLRSFSSASTTVSDNAPVQKTQGVLADGKYLLEEIDSIENSKYRVLKNQGL